LSRPGGGAFAEARASLLTGDQAAASANSLVYYYRDGQAPHFTGGLRQYCIAVRTPAGWRFREARIMLAWMHEN
jgi:hypothetical protein